MKNLRHTLAIVFLKTLGIFLQYLGFDIPPVTAVCAIIKKGNKILAVDLSYKKGLALPGGRIEREESLEEGLTREIREETGCEVDSIEYFTSHALRGVNLVGLTVCFKVNLKDYAKLKSSEEGIPVWVTPKEFLKKASYKDNKYFVRYMTRL